MPPPVSPPQHRTFRRQDGLRSLSELEIEPSGCAFRAPQLAAPLDHEAALSDALRLYERAALLVKVARARPGVSTRARAAAASTDDDDYEPQPSAAMLEFVWWVTPSDAVAMLSAEGESFRTSSVNTTPTSSPSISSTSGDVAFDALLDDPLVV